jgi:uncharacterized damage-inducible protein DinB
LSRNETAWEAGVRSHREAVLRFAETAERFDDVAWHARRASDKWCPGQVAEHVALAYGQLLSELSGAGGMRQRLPWWKATLLRWRFLPGILREGAFPAARAPREIRPPDSPRPKAALLDILCKDAARFEAELTRAQAEGGGRLTHPYFGRLPPRKILGFMAAHTEHHRRQLPGA